MILTRVIISPGSLRSEPVRDRRRVTGHVASEGDIIHKQAW
jgi:hypothetical protein